MDKQEQMNMSPNTTGQIVAYKKSQHHTNHFRIAALQWEGTEEAVAFDLIHQVSRMPICRRSFASSFKQQMF